MSSASFRHDVRDARKRIRCASVLSLACVIKVDLTRYRIVNNVLEDRAKHARRAIDVGLRFGGQFDHLRVTATFVVEQAVVGPPMLVVSDQTSLGIDGQWGLARSG